MTLIQRETPAALHDGDSGNVVGHVLCTGARVGPAYSPALTGTFSYAEPFEQS